MSERTPARLVEVDPDHHGQRLDNYLARLLSDLPRSAIYRIIRRGEVRVNGGRKQARHKLQVGDQVRLPPVTEREPQTPVAASDALIAGLEERILLETKHLLVINKPSGLAVHGGSGIHLGLIESLRQGRPHQFLELCHRLDRDTSGCLAIARTRRGLLAMQSAFKLQQVSKRYELIAQGPWQTKDRSVQAPLLRYQTAQGERRVKVSVDGKASRTDFQAHEVLPGASRVQATLHSGRTHQIRVHAAYCGHPVVGDQKYGSPRQRAHWQALGIDQLALHALRLRAELDGERIDVTAPLPARFERIWQVFQSEPSTG
ncbi:MAG: RluA family pseudouridine synthase [Pseudomonadales bacterium]